MTRSARTIRDYLITSSFSFFFILFYLIIAQLRKKEKIIIIDRTSWDKFLCYYFSLLIVLVKLHHTIYLLWHVPYTTTRKFKERRNLENKSRSCSHFVVYRLIKNHKKALAVSWASTRRRELACLWFSIDPNVEALFTVHGPFLSPKSLRCRRLMRLRSRELRALITAN